MGEYVATVRLEAACRLLTETGLSLKEVRAEMRLSVGGRVAAGVRVAHRGAAAAVP